MNDVFEMVKKEIKNEERPRLTNVQREANIFVRNMMKARATKVVVNKKYFEPILKTIRPDLKCEDGIMFGGVEIELGKCKKYYFVR